MKLSTYLLFNQKENVGHNCSMESYQINWLHTITSVVQDLMIKIFSVTTLNFTIILPCLQI